jgi:hypothetical protein
LDILSNSHRNSFNKFIKHPHPSSTHIIVLPHLRKVLMLVLQEEAVGLAEVTI